MRKLIAGIIFAACAVAVVGCETMKGVGRDVQDTGHNIQATASR